MAAVTTAAVAAVGVGMSFYGQMEAGKAARRAGELNAQDAEENARLSIARAAEDERQFRLSFRRENSRNIVNIGASGIKQEGSPIEALQDNAATAERDAQNIRAGGMQSRDAYLRQARNSRATGAAAGQAAQIQGAATLLSGAVSVSETGSKSGAWK